MREGNEFSKIDHLARVVARVGHFEFGIGCMYVGCMLYRYTYLVNHFSVFILSATISTIYLNRLYHTSDRNVTPTLKAPGTSYFIGITE